MSSYITLISVLGLILIVVAGVYLFRKREVIEEEKMLLMTVKDLQPHFAKLLEAKKRYDTTGGIVFGPNIAICVGPGSDLQDSAREVMLAMGIFNNPELEVLSYRIHAAILTKLPRSQHSRTGKHCINYIYYHFKHHHLILTL